MAVAYTTNLGLGLQDAGESNWDVIERQTFQRIEDRLALTATANPNGLKAVSWEGQRCWDTVNNIEYVGTVTGTATAATWIAQGTLMATALATTFSLATHNHSGVYEPVDADILRADTSDNVVVGYTGTSYTLSLTATSVTPNFTLGNIQDWSLSSGITLNAPTSTNAGCMIIETYNATTVTLTLATTYVEISGTFVGTSGNYNELTIKKLKNKYSVTIVDLGT